LQRRALLAAMAATGVTRAAPIMASAQTDTDTATATSRGVDVTQTYPITGYAPINGLQIYYEIHGSGGTPLLLLHGGIVGSVTFAPLLPGLSANRQVITIDLQGHGHTRDIDRPLRDETMADDVAGVLAHLEIEQADLLAQKRQLQSPGYILGRAQQMGMQKAERRYLTIPAAAVAIPTANAR